MESVVAGLRSISVTQEELNAAKKSMTIYLEDQTGSSLSKLEAMASHLAFGAHQAVTPAQMADLFNKANLSDVEVIHKKVLVKVTSSINYCNVFFKRPQQRNCPTRNFPWEQQVI